MGKEEKEGEGRIQRKASKIHSLIYPMSMKVSFWGIGP